MRQSLSNSLILFLSSIPIRFIFFNEERGCTGRQEQPINGFPLDCENHDREKNESVSSDTFHVLLFFYYKSKKIVGLSSVLGAEQAANLAPK